MKLKRRDSDVELIGAEYNADVRHFGDELVLDVGINHPAAVRNINANHERETDKSQNDRKNPRIAKRKDRSPAFCRWFIRLGFKFVEFFGHRSPTANLKANGLDDLKAECLESVYFRGMIGEQAYL